MPRDSTSSTNASGRTPRLGKAYWKKALKSIMHSQSVTMPRNLPELPMRLRPWFLVFTALIMVVLALLGFTDIAKNWPLNDKVLHCVCLGIATASFYFMFDVNEDARRIWFWRWSAVIITGVTCFIFGGIVSEIVQSLLPSKTFQFGDIVANLLGSSIGLYVAFHLEKYYRARREISRLYQPLYADDGESSDDEEVGPGAGLPFHSTQSQPSKILSRSKPTPKYSHGHNGSTGNVWDTSINMFDIGDEDDEDDEDVINPHRPRP